VIQLHRYPISQFNTASSDWSVQLEDYKHRPPWDSRTDSACSSTPTLRLLLARLPYRSCWKSWL